MHGLLPRTTLGLSLSITIACTPQSEGETATESTTTQGTTSETATDPTMTGPTSTSGPDCPPQVDSCSCFEVVSLTLTRQCETSVLCDRIDIACPDASGENNFDCPEATLTVMNPAALTCALQAMRDRKPGRIGWLLTPEGDGNDYAYWNRETELFVADADSAFVVENESLDLSAKYEDIRRIPLPATGILDMCLTMDAKAQFTCLRDALAGPAQEVCIPTFSGSLHGTLDECASDV